MSVAPDPHPVEREPVKLTKAQRAALQRAHAHTHSGRGVYPRKHHDRLEELGLLTIGRPAAWRNNDHPYDYSTLLTDAGREVLANGS